MVLEILQSKVEDRSVGGVEGSYGVVTGASSIKVGLRGLDSGEIDMVLEILQSKVEDRSVGGVKSSDGVVAGASSIEVRL